MNGASESSARFARRCYRAYRTRVSTRHCGLNFGTLKTSRLALGTSSLRRNSIIGAVRPASRARTSPIIELRSEEHTSELQSHLNLVCRLLLEKKNNILMIEIRTVNLVGGIHS